MPVDLNRILERGGKGWIDLMDYAVRSMQMDLLFLALVRDYRNHPTVPKAVALYELFCTLQAPARISVEETLPPRNLQLQAAIRPYQSAQLPVPGTNIPGTPRPPVLPPKYLFDSVACRLEQLSPALRNIRRRYKPGRSPQANLPGGKMTASQRHFVDKVWEPMIRPRLVAAGFWRVGTVA